MAKDRLYYYEKKAPYRRYELGEVQTNFNMSRVIDGTKDSMQVQVYNFNDVEIKPNTIINHITTHTWWIVKRDIVKRNANEKDYFYTHNLTLVGAIDLLNSRDLIDCGFNDKTYTIDQFIKRLFKLSTFEFPFIIEYGDNLDPNKMVDYIKSYENYTPLSALRDFLSGYNCDAKLEFEDFIPLNYRIHKAILRIIPKTGNLDLPILDIDDFDDVRETKTQSKESYGTTVITNAQNVFSTQVKTYPQQGGIKLAGSGYTVTPSNAFLQMPTKIYKVNWLKILHPVKVVWATKIGSSSQGSETITFHPYNHIILEKEFLAMAKAIADSLRQGGETNPQWQTIYNWIITHKSQILDPIIKASTITLKTGWKRNPVNGNFVAPDYDDEFYFPRIYKYTNGSATLSNAALVFGSKADHDSVSYQSRCMYYERGSDKIENFAWLTNYDDQSTGASPYYTEIRSYEYTDLRSSSYDSGNYINKNFNFGGSTDNITIHLARVAGGTNHNYLFNPANTYFIVNYIPMSDIKIKIDNYNDTLDTHLYNQNGKINDSVALSKLLDSYSKEIQNDNITRYMYYTDFDYIPQIGQRVQVGNEIYVINNISYDFYTNETNNEQNVGYYIECEFTLSKYVSTKSIMTSPNSNIRDYGIPQEYNVRRKQVNRDYFEFSFTIDQNATNNPLVSISNYIETNMVDIKAKDYSHTAIMKIDYEEHVDENESWYYQLNTTTYMLKKTLYEIVEFPDNNIIGYDMQNTTSGFDMSRWWSTSLRVAVTPISYVDNNGRFKGITLQMLNATEIGELYDAMLKDSGETDPVMFSAHCFVGEEMYWGKYTVEPILYVVELNNHVGTIVNSKYISINLTELGLISGDTDIIDNEITLSNTTLYITNNGSKVHTYTQHTVSSYGVEKRFNQWYLLIELPTTDYANYGYDLTTKINYRAIGNNYTYHGAVDRADYSLTELEYYKDAIEVPVFEYAMQIGDNEFIEVGDDILNNQDAMFIMYGCSIKTLYSVNTLSASKEFEELDVSGDLYDSDDYNAVIEISDVSNVVMSFEQNDTILRIKFYSSQVATFYQVKPTIGTVEFDNVVNGTQINKSNLIGKDIVIYKNIVKELEYFDDEAYCNYEQELMFVIHNAQESNFDGNDLILHINHYKLN